MKKGILYGVIVALCVSCNNVSSGNNRSYKDSSLMVSSVPASAGASSGDTVKIVRGKFYDAFITPSGTVKIKFDDKNVAEIAEDLEIPCRVSGEYKVDNLSGKIIVDIYGAEDEKERSATLFMLSDKGEVMLLDVIRAISTGDVACGAPNYGITGVKSIKVSKTDTGVSYSGCYADGNTVKIGKYSGGGYFMIDDFEIMLTTDGLISFNAEAINYHKNGVYYIDPNGSKNVGGENNNLYKIRLHDGTEMEMRMGGRPSDSGNRYFVFEKSSSDFPLQMNKKLSAKSEKMTVATWSS